jgi:CheY-like chemotaxis protein
MTDFEIFRDELREALYHLQDVRFEPSEVLCATIGCAQNAGAGPVQTQVIAAIKSIEPDQDTPQDSRAWLHFESLNKRFVLGLSQEETAEYLHMSIRNVQRVQKEAIHILARTVWQFRPDADQVVSSVQARDWQSQADLEMASLRKTMPDAQSDLDKVIQEVIDLEAALLPKLGIEVNVGFVQPNLIAAAHPSVLRQTLITAIGNLASNASISYLMIYAALEDGQVKITITGSLTDKDLSIDETAITEIIAPPNASVELHQRGQKLFLQVKLPVVGNRNILVVEDNPDMVYFYRRCTTGTMYRIIQIPTDQDLFMMVEKVNPDLIILDVMLPDIDGWQLLSHLRERTATRDIPVIVCSVVKEKNLAMALGATAFLSKPIRPRQFVAELDQALHQASSEASTPPKHSAAVY